ncbi:type II toxin-antitoxin system RelE/ParE family toxin [Chryseobacterium sp. GP-SGM7]|uniref:type II toxin-antitoxin system RelE/ParE family toxin n=1 Tax=Chryseobacterium sp. GP-SGM7 TaxID=3411323 RepID=UPI003B95E14C
MAKRLIWSSTAKIIRKEILQFWITHNKSAKYSKILNAEFNKNAKQIAELPSIGIEISDSIYRGKLVKDYYLLYAIKEEIIEILFIWDTRQNPIKLLNFIKSFKK